MGRWGVVRRREGVVWGIWLGGGGVSWAGRGGG